VHVLRQPAEHGEADLLRRDTTPIHIIEKMIEVEPAIQAS